MTEFVHTETTDTGTYRVRVQRPELNDAESPRTFGSNVAVMVLKHPKYDLPFEGDLAERIDKGMLNTSFPIVARWLRAFHGARVVLPVWGYDHGELHLKAGERTYPFDDAFDSGLAGLVYDTPTSRAYLAGEDPTDEQITEALTTEISQYDQWSNNDLYEAVTEKLTGTDPDDDGDWEEIGCTSEYFSEQEAFNEGKRAMAEHITEWEATPATGSLGPVATRGPGTTDVTERATAAGWELPHGWRVMTSAEDDGTVLVSVVAADGGLWGQASAGGVVEGAVPAASDRESGDRVYELMTTALEQARAKLADAVPVIKAPTES